MAVKYGVDQVIEQSLQWCWIDRLSNFFSSGLMFLDQSLNLFEHFPLFVELLYASNALERGQRVIRSNKTEEFVLVGG